MDEQLQEQASLYALGALPVEERAAFESRLADDAELRALVDALSATAAAVARTVPRREPPPHLKAAILARVQSGAARPAAVSTPPKTDAGSSASPDAPSKIIVFPQWIPWAAAAALAVSTAWLATERGTLRGETARLRERVVELSARVAEMDAQVAGLNGQMDSMRAELVMHRTADPFAGLRVAVLESTPGGPAGARGVSVWDAQRQNGMLVVEKLAALPADKDYQLWVIDPAQAAPVSAGVFSVDAQGVGRLQFKPVAAVATAGKFAVTVENKGGVSSPTLSAMVLIGG